MTKEVLIVEDHIQVQKTLREFIARMENFNVFGAVPSGERALELLQDIGPPDLLLVDMALPRMSGAALVAKVQVKWPKLICVLLSGHGEASYVQHALSAGARGYILKGNPAEIEPALEAIVSGEIYLSEPLR